MKIGELISTVRQLIKEVQDDSKYTDSFLWSIISTCAKDKSTVHNRTRFCIELERVKHHDCSCVSVGCDVLKTKHKVPTPIKATILTMDGNTVGHSFDQELKFNMYDPIKSNAIRYNFHNQFLYIYNTLDLKYVQLEGTWENVTDWINVQYCGNSVGTTCVDVYELESGIARLDTKDVYEQVFRLLQIPLSRPDDTSTNRNPEIR
jgi:hypothetical protein